mgnify:CR=1 FL=1
MAWVSKEQHHPPQAQHHPCPHHDKQTEWHFVLPGPSNLHLSRHEPPPPVASTTCEHYDVQFPVPPNRTVVRYGQLSDAMPEQTCFTICSNFTQSDARAVGLDKNLAGHGVGHGVTGCSHSSVAGHQQPELANTPVSLYVMQIVRTVARAVSLIYYLCSLDSEIHPGCTTSSVVWNCLPSLVHNLDGADLRWYWDMALIDVFLFSYPV